MLDIDLSRFDAVRLPFRDEERRSPFFEMSRSLVESGKRHEGYLLLLATWDFAYFRCVNNHFDMERFTSAIDEFENIVSELGEIRFSEKGFPSLPQTTKAKMAMAYDALMNCKIESSGHTVPLIGSTSSTKIMQLALPNTFVMWDSYIRGSMLRSERKYEHVDPQLIKTGWKLKRYADTGTDYVEFLMDMREAFSPILEDYESKHRDKSVNKAIDEFNYMAITKPIMAYEKELHKLRRGAQTDQPQELENRP